ncbi:MAG: hypothetical protein JNJ59_15360 [Deltaproteobacteria bacterium]|nr:hypothetical protein [Deltaproteobacteria bacterium]
MNQQTPHAAMNPAYAEARRRGFEAPSKAQLRQDRAAPSPVERAAAAHRVTARISSGRPFEALLFERPDTSGLAIVVALVDRRTGTLALLTEARELTRPEAKDLREVAKGGEDAPPLAEVSLEVARLRLARAILATRVAGGEVPDWLATRSDLVGDPAHPSSKVDDIYLCIACDRALPPSEQLLRAELGGHSDTPPRCPRCRGEHVTEASEGDAWIARGWLMIAARLPRRALVCAARAEGLRALSNPASAQLDALRGAALMALGDHAAAAPHLRRALNGEPDHARAAILEGWLAQAEYHPISSRVAA